MSMPVIAADIGAWFWVIIVVFWIVVSIVQQLRRGASLVKKRIEYDADKALQQAEFSPQGQRLARAVQTIAQQAQGAPASAQTIVTAAQNAAANAPAQYATTVAESLAALRAPQARQAMISDLTTLVRGIADQGAAAATTLGQGADLSAGGTAPLTLFDQTAPAAATMPSRFASLATAQGFAYAIVASTVIGPPQGLRSEPMMPGGW
ncbi:MAG TPA: hypothetical protein VFF60_08765 [Candidatus Binatus sp.]|nr:hypothetical protein [Candidatus Binatus sp.]